MSVHVKAKQNENNNNKLEVSEDLTIAPLQRFSRCKKVKCT